MKIQIGNSLIENEVKLWTLPQDKYITIENDEMTIEYVTRAYFTYLNLSKYDFFRVCFEIFNPKDNRIEFGIKQNQNGIYFQQDVYDSHIYLYRNDSKIPVKSFSTNLFSQTNIWRSIQIEKNKIKGYFKIEENIADFPKSYFGDNFYLRTWWDGSMKVRNIQIFVPPQKTFNIHRERISLVILFICLIAIK